LLCEEFRKKQKRINPSSRAGASSSSCCKVLEVDFADQTATMSARNGYSPGFGPAPPPPKRAPPIPKPPPSPPPPPPYCPPCPPPPPHQYARQASNQGYHHHQQQPTSGSSGAVVVVAPQYCLPHELSLAVTKKVRSSSRGDWTIRDPEGNILFSVDGNVRTVGNRRHLHLLDAAGYKVIHMEQQRKVSNNIIFLMQQRGLKWCPKSPKPYIMNLSLSHLIPCALLLVDRTLNFLRKIWSVTDEHSLECLLSKHYMMLEEIRVCGSQFFLV